MKNCYKYDLYSHKLTRTDDLNEARASHGLITYSQKVCTFGGCEQGCIPIQSAEVYDMNKDSWSKLLDMPEVGDRTSLARIQKKILICSWSFNLMSYDVSTESYEYLGER